MILQSTEIIKNIIGEKIKTNRHLIIFDITISK